MFQLNFSGARTAADVPLERRSIAQLPEGPVADTFIQSCAAAFEAILNYHKKRTPAGQNDTSVFSAVETADLLALHDVVEGYSKAYLDLANHVLDLSKAPSLPKGLRSLLAEMDVTEVRWRPSPGDPGRALLVGPTHPLRMLWHLQHADVCSATLMRYRDGGRQIGTSTAFLAQLRQMLVPANLPMVLFDDKGRGYVEQGLLTPFWSLYLPDRVDSDQPIDISSSRDALRRILGIKGKSSIIAGISSEVVAARIIEYLFQHPYAEQLRINVFNPGDGQLIADALREVERTRAAISSEGANTALRYSIQMFGASEQLESMGEAVESLLDPDRQVAEDDEFTLASSNHLLPKLVFGRNTVQDFLRDPSSFTAHISIFLEHFNVRCRLGSTTPLGRGSYVSALIQEPSLQTEDLPSRFGWYKGLRPVGRKNADKREKLIESLLDVGQRLSAALSCGRAHASRNCSSSRITIGLWWPSASKACACDQRLGTYH